MLDLTMAQSYMKDHSIDAWLVYDFRHHNPVMAQIIGEIPLVTRRMFLVIPADKPPFILAHRIDESQFSADSFPVACYTTWEEFQASLKDILKTYGRVAMEYSPGGTLPTSSWVDAGTIDLVRSLGVEVVSAANVFQLSAATWSSSAVESHRLACHLLAGIKDQSFEWVHHAIQNGAAITEYDVQEFILQRFVDNNLETEGRPVVAVNENSADPHYVPDADRHSPIQSGDWLLVDIWARIPGDENVYSDITWVAYIGHSVPSKNAEVFTAVKNARDLVINRLKDAWAQGDKLHGYELDRIARQSIADSGYGPYFNHRTGHSIGPGEFVHALGVNLDDFETHDTREILPGIGFSVEPGIYISEFGVRSEVNVYIDPDEGPTVTTPIQREIICIG